MTRLAFTLFATLALVGCGEGETREGKAFPRPVPTTADRATRVAALPAPYDQADLDNGRAVFARCRSCHTVTEGGPNMTGPNLFGVFGRLAGGQSRYNYSTAVKTAGFTWDAERLDHWLENPRTFLRGTKMSFPGIPDADDRRDVIAWLKVETGYAPPTQP